MLVIATHLAVGGLLLIAAVCDFRAFRIPNFIPLALLALFVGTWFLGQQTAVPLHLGNFAIASVLGIALYAFGLWGGGDAKLMAALALFLVPSEMARFLVITTVTGGILAIAFLVDRRVATGPDINTGHIPYGIALATGGLDWCLLS